MAKQFSVEIRDDCKICGGDLPTKRHRTFCSPECLREGQRRRSRENYDPEVNARQMRQAQQKKLLAKYGKENLVQCYICADYAVKVASHAWQKHGVSADEYKEMFGLERIKGVVPEWWSEEMGEITLENESYKHLEEVGKPTRFKKGDPSVGKYERRKEHKQKLAEHIRGIGIGR